MKSRILTQKALLAILVLVLLTGQLSIVPSKSTAQAASTPNSSGATYFVDTDTWGGGAADTPGDNDLAGTIGNGNNTYPIDLKFEDIDQLPSSKAQLIVRAYDVDEFENSSSTGEWDRVYYSANAEELNLLSPVELGDAATNWPTSNSGWINLTDAYKREIHPDHYVGALSGANNIWNTSVFNLDPNKVVEGENFFRLTTHHYYLDTTRTPNTGWVVKVAWIQLVIDGGQKINAEITDAKLKVENGLVTIDTSFLPKVEGNYSFEVSIIEKSTNPDGSIIERNLGIGKELFMDVPEGEEKDAKTITLRDSKINPNNEYAVNIILFQDTGVNKNNGTDKTDPKIAEHIVSISTHDPVVEDIHISGYRAQPTTIAAQQFKDHYFRVNGHAPNGDNLKNVEILTLPDAEKGSLFLDGAAVYEGQIIAVADLDKLVFQPVTDGFDGIAEFLWNGINVDERGAVEPAKVIINSSPDILDFTRLAKFGESLISFTGSESFEENYIDPGDEELDHLIIISLPDAAKGKLVLVDSGGRKTDVTSQMQIPYSQLNELMFEPVESFKGSVEFQWNAYDGIQYAKQPATTTVKIVDPPIVGNINKVVADDNVLTFTAEEFIESTSYPDVTIVELEYIQLNIPSDIESYGKLTYDNGAGKMDVTPGQLLQLTPEEASTLEFKPKSGLLSGTTFTIKWNGFDGNFTADEDGIINITYLKRPIADPKEYIVGEGETAVSIQLSGSYNGLPDGITLDEITVEPSKGKVEITQGSDGLSLVYVPNAAFKYGTDTFKYTVVNAEGTISDEAEVFIHLEKNLNGWAGDKQEGDSTIVDVLPTEVLPLQAVSSIFAESVKVTINSAEVELQLKNADTYETDGYKLWSNDHYELPANTVPGVHTVVFSAYDESDKLIQEEANLEDNKINYLKYDPIVKDISVSGYRDQPTPLTNQLFKDAFLQSTTEAPNGENLKHIRFDTLPDPTKGSLSLKGKAVTVGQQILIDEIDYLTFVPAEAGFDGIVDFTWNGYNGKKYSDIPAKVIINSAPELTNINKAVKPDEREVLFDGEHSFIANYIDPGNETLQYITIIATPDPEQGKLVLVDSIGKETDVVSGEKIPANQIDQLKLIPKPNYRGDIRFTWNGNDGIQNAKTDATATITVVDLPEAQSFAKAAYRDEVIGFTVDDFTSHANYPNEAEVEVQYISITLPSNSADFGIFSYYDGATMIDIDPGKTVEIHKDQIASLQVKPNSDLEMDSEFKIQWNVKDNNFYGNSNAEITLSYYGEPIADPKTVIEKEGTTTVPVQLSGSYNGSTTGIIFDKITVEPLKGKVEITPGSDGLTVVYVPNSEFKFGTDTFKYTVLSEQGISSEEVEVMIHLAKDLNGWVGAKQEGDTTIPNIIPGEILPLSAVSSVYAEEVFANVNGERVQLTLVNSSTWENDQYKAWSNTSYVLPITTGKGNYTPKFTAYDADSKVLQEESNLEDNKINILAPVLTLTANPEQILGDGVSTTELVAVLKLDDGTPVANVEVQFQAPSNSGIFVENGTNEITVITDAKGEAKVIYKAPKITGVDSKDIVIKGVVYDQEKGLNASEDITITFLPASIHGVLTKGPNNEPIRNATVTVTLDLDGDGIIDPAVDFVASVVTDEEGAYDLIVPRGDSVYNVEISQTVTMNGVDTEVTYKQQAKVGQVQGIGDEIFDSEKTATGIVLFHNANSVVTKLPANIISHTKVFVKDSTDQYVKDASGNPIGFVLDADGIFTAEGLNLGQYTLEYRYEYEPDQYMVLSTSTVTINDSGEMNIVEALVDPYGTVTDRRTGEVIEGVKVELYYADTLRNRNKGIQPNTAVKLPEIPGFEPNDNASPVQLTDAHGFYAYMVYPETDYYLVFSHPQYNSHTSKQIPVEWEIVRYDVSLSKDSTSSNQLPDPTLTMDSTSEIVKETEKALITTTFNNSSIQTIQNGKLVLKIPAGVTIIDVAGGKIENGTITWPITELASGETFEKQIVVQWPKLDAGEAKYTFISQIVSGQLELSASKQFVVQSEALLHYRYILGYPDQTFKPNRNITRAEIAAIVARLTLNETIDYELPYTDIRDGHWATNYIKIATKSGYFKPDATKAFRPDEPITRGELVTVVARFLGVKDSEVSNYYFTDTKGHWAGSMIEKLYSYNYLKGYPNKTFMPNQNIIRVEAVTLINRMLDRGPLKGVEQMFPDMPTTHWGFGDVQEATNSHEAERNADGSESFIKKLTDNMQ